MKTQSIRSLLLIYSIRSIQRKRPRKDPTQKKETLKVWGEVRHV